MRVYFAEDMFKHSPSIIGRDDVSEGFLGKWYVSTENHIGNGLGKCQGHDDVVLTVFIIEVFYHNR